MCTKTHVTLPAVVYKIEMASSSRKRPRSDSPSSISSKSRHKIGYNPTWKTDFPWHIPVYGSSDSDSDGSVVGLLCSTCKLHRTKQRNNAGNWTDLPRKSLRRDVLQRHKESSMHKEALEQGNTRLASERDGGIRQAFSSQVQLQRKDITGALHLLLYIGWLRKKWLTQLSFIP